MTASRIKVPLPLKSGDIVRVISPAGPVDEAALLRGVRRLERWGYRVEIAPAALNRSGYLAGSDDERLEDLTNALLDSEVRGIFCSRGGYGSARLLSQIPWNEMSRIQPKVFVGFSDIGALQLTLFDRCRWVTFSGPQVARGLGGEISDRAANHLKGMIDGSRRKFAWDGDNVTRLRQIRSGAADGPLIGCCLSIMTSLVGTEWFPNLDGTILVLEDIDEPPYRIDRMFWQLVASGRLNQINALVLGHFIQRGEDIVPSVINIVNNLTGHLPFPVWSGIPYGHVNEYLTLPVGAPAKIGEDGEMVVSLDGL